MENDVEEFLGEAVEVGLEGGGVGVGHGFFVFFFLFFCCCWELGVVEVLVSSLVTSRKNHHPRMFEKAGDAAVVVVTLVYVSSL